MGFMNTLNKGSPSYPSSPKRFTITDGEISFVEPKGKFVTALIICSNCELAKIQNV